MFKYLLPLFIAVNCAAQNIDIVGPFNGLNDTDSSVTIGQGYAQDLLNVDISADGQSISKRKGYSQDTALTYSTSPITGSIKFKDSLGRNIRIFTYDKFVMASIDGSAYASILSTYTAYAKYNFCEGNGIIYAFNDSHDTPFGYNGTAITYYPSWPKGSICSITPERLLISGTTDYPNRLYASAVGDYTDFTVGTENTDPFFEAVGLSGEKITAIYATQAEWIVFKRKSLVSYQGQGQFDLLPNVISGEKGTVDPKSVIEHEGVVYFLETDGKIYAYSNGSIVDISKSIETFEGHIPRDVVYSKSYTDKSDFDAGTYAYTTGSVTSGSIEPVSYTMEDTLDADFNAGAIAGSSITVYNDAITITPGFPNGTFSNIGFESGSFSPNWTYGNSTFISGAVISSNTGYGSYISTFTNSSSSCGAARRTISIYCSPYQYDFLNSSLVSGTNTLSIPLCDGLRGYINVYVYPAQISGGCNGLATIDSSYFILASSITVISSLGGGVSAGSYVTFDINQPNAVDITSATFISRVATTSASSGINYGYIVSTNILNSGSVDYFVRHSTSVNGSWSLWSATTDYLLIQSTDTYWQYKANMYKVLGTTGPAVQGVQLTFKTTGYWESPAEYLGSVSDWGSFTANDVTNGSADWTYKIRSSTWSGGLASATYYDIATSSSIGIALGDYAQIKAVNTFVSATETVRVNDIAFSYVRGPGAVANAFEYNNDIYFAVPYSTSNTNSRVAKLVTELSAWTIYDIPMAYPFVDGDSVLFGSPTGGYIYTYPSGDNDAGSAINSYWKSKNFIGNPYVEKQFDKLSSVWNSDYGSSVDVTYTIDTSTNTTYTIALTSTTADFVRNNRQLPIGSNGSFFNLQIGNNAANNPWTFYGARIDYKDDTWAVTPQ